VENDEYYPPNLFDSSVSVDDVTDILHDESLKVDNHLPELSPVTSVIVGDIEHVVVEGEVQPMDTRTSKEKLSSKSLRQSIVKSESQSANRLRRPVAK